MPLLGRPQLSMTLVTWPGSSVPTAESTNAATLPASSRRNPIGARKCMSISPDLMPGKKSRPSQGTSRIVEASAAARNPVMNRPRRSTTLASNSR